MENIGDAIEAFKKCTELNSNDNLAKMQFYYLSLDKNSYITYKNTYNFITNINQISNDKSLLSIRCKIYIELKEYLKAKLDLDRLFKLNNEDISFVYSLKQYSDFWSYLCKSYDDSIFIKLG